jgi:alpha-amylase
MFSGGNDPANRESLWNVMNTDSDMYKYVAKINAARKAAQVWTHKYVERYASDNFFSFSFGDMVVMTTNSQNTVDIDMTFTPYEDGTQVCNVFYPEHDCQTISGGKLHAHLEGGESKIWLPKSLMKNNAMPAEFLQ